MRSDKTPVQITSGTVERWNAYNPINRYIEEEGIRDIYIRVPMMPTERAPPAAREQIPRRRPPRPARRIRRTAALISTQTAAADGKWGR